MRQLFVIYGLFDPRDGELRYVGQTSRGKNRFWEHTRKREISKRTHLGHWLQGLLASGAYPVYGVIQAFSTDEGLNDAEVYWIAFFRAAGCRLTNFADGGERKYPRGWVMPQSTRDKLAAAQRGRKHTPEELAKMAAAGVARWKNPEYRETQLVALREAGKRGLSMETRMRMSAAKKGVPRGPVAMKKAWATRKRNLENAL